MPSRHNADLTSPLGYQKFGVYLSWEKDQNSAIPNFDSVINWENGNLVWIVFIETGSRQMEVGFKGGNKWMLMSIFTAIMLFTAVGPITP
jgi:hypothetical protein